MKKFAIGCLGVFVVLAAVGGFFAYKYIVRPVQGVVKNAEQFSQIADLNKQVNNSSSFTAPADGVLSQEQLDRFLAVQAGMKEKLATTVQQLDEKYKQIEAQDRNPNFKELMTAYSDLLKLVLEAKRVQVQELNDQNFSLAEYSWVKREAIRATGIPFSYLDLTQLTSENAVQAPAETSTVPEANVKLLEPYKDKLEETFGLAFFGL